MAHPKNKSPARGVLFADAPLSTKLSKSEKKAITAAEAKKAHAANEKYYFADLKKLERYAEAFPEEYPKGKLRPKVGMAHEEVAPLG